MGRRRVVTIEVLLSLATCEGLVRFGAPVVQQRRMRPPLSSSATTVTTTTEEEAPRKRKTEELFELASTMLDLETSEKVGSVRFSRGTEGEEELLYVPGIEFRGVSIGGQLESLERSGYATTVAWVQGEDRTSFQELSDAVYAYCEAKNVSVLIGESFGGLVAADVAMRREDERKPLKVVLVNPATSYPRSFWARSQAGGAVAVGSPTGYAAAVAAAVGLLASDGSMVRESVNDIRDGKGFELLQRAWSSAQALTSRVPASTLKFRLDEWLGVGSKIVDQKLFLAKSRRKKRQQPGKNAYLVLAGSEDRFLPSAEEARRLARVLPENRTEVRLLKSGGHALLVDPERLDLGAALRQSKVLYPPTQKRKDPVADFSLPSADEIEDTRNRFIRPFRRLTSPVFLSKGDKGFVRGLDAVPLPQNRPVLLVGNHQLFGLDLGLLVDEFLAERNELIRGLAHPAATGAQAAVRALSNSQQGVPIRSAGDWWRQEDSPSSSDDEEGTFFTKFGAVQVTPRNFFRLMQRNQTALLFPGGVRESNHGKTEAHTLFWPNSTDFVRVAAVHDALVVPFGAVGVADSFAILRDKDQPLFNRQQQDQRKMPSARRWAGDESEDFRFPLAVPSPRGPARVYFLFQPPRDTSYLDPKDRHACAHFYADVKHDVQDAIDTLLHARASDPFERPGPRLALEAVANALPPNNTSYPPQQAPTFPLSTLSRQDHSPSSSRRPPR